MPGSGKIFLLIIAALIGAAMFNIATSYQYTLVKHPYTFLLHELTKHSFVQEAETSSI